MLSSVISPPKSSNLNAERSCDGSSTAEYSSSLSFEAILLLTGLALELVIGVALESATTVCDDLNAVSDDALNAGD